MPNCQWFEQIETKNKRKSFFLMSSFEKRKRKTFSIFFFASSPSIQLENCRVLLFSAPRYFSPRWMYRKLMCRRLISSLLRMVLFPIVLFLLATKFIYETCFFSAQNWFGNHRERKNKTTSDEKKEDKHNSINENIRNWLYVCQCLHLSMNVDGKLCVCNVRVNSSWKIRFAFFRFAS